MATFHSVTVGQCAEQHDEVIDPTGCGEPVFDRAVIFVVTVGPIDELERGVPLLNRVTGEMAQDPPTVTFQVHLGVGSLLPLLTSEEFDRLEQSLVAVFG